MSNQSRPIFTGNVLSTAAIPACRAVGWGTGALAAAGANSKGCSRMPALGAGERITVDMLGTAQGEAGAAFAAEVLLEADAQGRYILNTTGKAIARSVEAATAAGQVVEIFLLPN